MTNNNNNNNNNDKYIISENTINREKNVKCLISPCRTLSKLCILL